MKEMELLLSQAENIQRFTLYDIITYGKIISVYDGDTEIRYYYKTRDSARKADLKHKVGDECRIA